MMPTVAEQVAEARRKAGLNQKQLAEKAGLPRQTIYRIEAGHVQPTLPVLGKIAQALGTVFVVSNREI